MPFFKFLTDVVLLQKIQNWSFFCPTLQIWTIFCKTLHFVTYFPLTLGKPCILLNNIHFTQLWVEKINTCTIWTSNVKLQTSCRVLCGLQTSNFLPSLPWTSNFKLLAEPSESCADNTFCKLQLQTSCRVIIIPCINFKLQTSCRAI